VAGLVEAVALSANVNTNMPLILKAVAPPPTRSAIALCALASCGFRAWPIGVPAGILAAHVRS
jgi:hypothetical protein